MTDFASLGLDPATIASDLETLGLDVSAYYDEITGEYSDELASLMLVANLVLKQGIFETATSVEELIGDYQFQADVLSAMNKTLQLALDAIGTNGSVNKLVKFVQEEIEYATIDDLDSYEIDYAIEGSSFTTETFETLADYVDAIENNTEIANSDGTLTYGTLEWELSKLLQENEITWFYLATGSPTTADTFLAGSVESYLQISIDPSLGINVYMNLDQFKQYLVLNALQDAGIVSEDLDLSLANFADTAFSRGSDYTNSSYWAEWIQLYFGKSSYSYDDDGALVVTHNGSAMCRVMGIDLEDYCNGSGDFQSPDDNYDWIEDLPSPMGEESYSTFIEMTAGYVWGNLIYVYAIAKDSDATEYDGSKWSKYDWSTYSANYLTTNTKWIDADDLDDILEGLGSQVQSQASISQLALVETSTAITEWSEFHNGWDTAHKYISEALGRCMAFLK